MPPPSKLADYRVLETIGKGSFGTCRKVESKEGKVLVAKEINYGQMSEKEKENLVTEVNLLREFRHPHIVRYVDRIVERDSTTIHIIMEFCEGGDLAGLIKKHKRDRKYMDEEFVWRMFSQVLLAMQACLRHKDGVVLHRDLKPANIFLDKKQNAKIGDFGLARILSSTASFAHTYLGTPYYMSPEQTNDRAYNEKSDIWALGCLVYELAALVPPFDAPNHALLAMKINDGRFQKLPEQFSEPLYTAIKMMLQRDPTKRPSVDQLLAMPAISSRLAAAAVASQELAAQKQAAAAAKRRGDKPPKVPAFEAVVDSDVALDPPIKIAAAADPDVAPVASRPDSCPPPREAPESHVLQAREQALLAKENSLLALERALADRARAIAAKERELDEREARLQQWAGVRDRRCEGAIFAAGHAALPAPFRALRRVSSLENGLEQRRF